MSDVTDFKTAIISMFREVKGIMPKEVKDGDTVFHQKKIINKVIEIIYIFLKEPNGKSEVEKCNSWYEKMH